MASSEPEVAPPDLEQEPNQTTDPTDKPEPELGNIPAEATFGDVENCSSLPIVTEVTSLAHMDHDDTPSIDQTDGNEEEEMEEGNDEEIEDMLIPHTEREYPEEHDAIPDTELPVQKSFGTDRSEDGSMDSCEFCHILIPTRMLEDHLRIHQQLDEPLPCPKAKCTNEFLTAFDLKNHLLSIHPGTKDIIPVVYNCNNCGKEMSMLSAFQIHAKHKHPNSMVKCTKELRLTRAKNGEFVCPVCVKCFQTRKIIVKHFNDVHQLAVKLETTIVVGSDKPDIPEPEMEPEVDGLLRQSARLSARAQEMSPPSMLRGALVGAPGLSLAGLPGTSHGLMPPNMGEAEAIVCPSCNEVYYDMAAFKRHYYRHTVRYTCRVCNKKIMGMAEYREHCGKHINRPRAPGEVKRTCPYCGKSFIDMKIHLRKHESSCELCGLQFVHLNNMNRHYLDVHGIDLSQFAKMPDGPGGRKMNTSLDVKLDGYHKTLASIEQFEAETSSPVTVKTEKVDVTCEYCALTYPSQELFNRHVITHNQKCKLCQVVIDHEQNIRPHLKTAHGINDVDNVASLFEQTIFAEINDPLPLELPLPTPPPVVVPPRGNKRDSLEEPDFSGRGQKRDMAGRAECKICYRKVIDMNSHMTTHNVKCSLCDYISIHRFNLRPHMRQAHGLNDDEIDALIEDIVANPIQVWDIPPENRIHNRPGAPPSKTLQTPESSISPATSSPIHTPPPEPGREQCRFCVKQFSAENMKRHVQFAHNVKCRRCGKFFVHQASIYAHMKTLHGLNDPDQMRRETIYCQMSDEEEEDWPTHSPVPEEEPPRKVFKPEPKPKPIPKPVMKSPSPSPSPKPSSSGVKGKKCKVCKQVFEDIVGHMNTHYKPCPLCETQFHPQGFRAHLKQKHGITDPEAVRSLEEDSSDEESDDKEQPEERDVTPEPETLPTPVPQQSITVKTVPVPQTSSATLPVESGKCEICNKNVRDFHEHMSTRHNLKCVVCKTIIKHFCNVKSHMSGIHGIADPDVRELTVSTYKPSSTSAAPDPHGPLEVSNSVLDLSNEVSSNEEERIQCEFCESSLKNRKYYAQHCRNIHKIKLPDKRKHRGIKDEDSGKTFLNQFSGSNEFTMRQHLVPTPGAALDGHIASNRGGTIANSHTDRTTNGKVASAMDVHTPLQAQTTEHKPKPKVKRSLLYKPYECDRCHKHFHKRRYLWRHFKVRHNEPDAFSRYRAAGKIMEYAGDDPVHKEQGQGQGEVMEESTTGESENESAMEEIPEEEEELPPDVDIDEMKIDNEEIFKVSVEKELLKGVTTQSEITRRRRLLAKHKSSLRVQGGLGFGSYKCKHCHRRFTTSSALARHTRQDSCPMILLKRQRRERLGYKLKSGAGTSGDSVPLKTGYGRSDKVSDFRCELCKIYLSSGVSLQRHLLTHTGEKPIKCCVCLKGFNQNVHLRAHLARYHGIPMESSRNIGIENRSIQVQLLQKFKPEALKKLPPAENVEMTCMVCKKGFTDSAKLREHLNVHANKLPYQCSRCPRGYESEAQLRLHLMRVHSMTPSATLNPVTSSQEEEEMEEKEESAESDMDEYLPEMKANLRCFRCKTPIKNIDDNLFHGKTHRSNVAKNYCFVCWSPFSDVRSLARHFLTVHSDRTGSDDTASHCRICNATVMNLPKHSRQCHPDVNMDMKACKCHYCGQKFNSLIQRKVHVIAKHDQDVKRKMMLNRRSAILQRIVHAKLSSKIAKPKPSQSAIPHESASVPETDIPLEHEVKSKSWCEDCNLSYVNIQSHRVCHSGIPTYDCTNCGRIYASAGTRRRHMIKCTGGQSSPSIHSTSTSTSVQDSDTTGNYKPPSSVTRSTASSGGYCQYCKCEIPMRLHNHLITVHRRGKKPRSRCELCGRMFSQRSHKRRHMQVEHPDEDVKTELTSDVTDDGERPVSRSSIEFAEMPPLRNVRVMLERVDGIKPEPEDWTLKLESTKTETSRIETGKRNVKGTRDSDAAAAVNSEHTPRSTPTSSRPASRDGRPSIFELIKNSSEEAEEEETKPDEEASKNNQDGNHASKSDQDGNPTDSGEVRYVRCSACPTYLPTRKSDQQLLQFKLMCNACLKVDASKLSSQTITKSLSVDQEGPSDASKTKTARKSTNPRKQLMQLVQTVAGEITKRKPSPKSKSRSRVIAGLPFLPRPKKRSSSAKCEKCGMKFQNKSALSSHDRLLHVGPCRLREGIQIVTSTKCEFCGIAGVTKKTQHLRRCHPELFMNGLFKKNSEKELKLARLRGLDEPDVISISSSEQLMGVASDGGEGVEEEVEDLEEVDLEESTSNDVSYENMDDVEDAQDQSMDCEEGPPDLEYQGGPGMEPAASPPELAPPIGSPVAPE